MGDVVEIGLATLRGNDEVQEIEVQASPEGFQKLCSICQQVQLLGGVWVTPFSRDRPDRAILAGSGPIRPGPAVLAGSGGVGSNPAKMAGSALPQITSDQLSCSWSVRRSGAEGPTDG